MSLIETHLPYRAKVEVFTANVKRMDEERHENRYSDVLAITRKPAPHFADAKDDSNA